MRHSHGLWQGKPIVDYGHRHAVRLRSTSQIAFGIALTILLSMVCRQEMLGQSDSLETPQTPPDYQRHRAASGAAGSSLRPPAISPEDSYPVVREVWLALLHDTVLQGLDLPFRWKLSVVDSNALNASSSPDGQVIVDRSLANLLGQSRGLWAALLSHEIAHVAQRHWQRRSSFESQLQQRLQNYSTAPFSSNSRWQMAAFDAQMDGPEALARFSRSLELDADTEGMMLMARTGFHPDFELAIRHLLEANSGESFSFDATSPTHPRWSTREGNSRKTYSRALEEFSRRWPTAILSPGGAPPTVIFLGKPKSRSSRKGPSTVTFSLRCVNPGQPLRAVLRLFEKKSKLSNQSESVEYWKPTTCSEDNEERVLSVVSPKANQVEREWIGELVILNADDIALERSAIFTIRFSKVEKPSAWMQ